MRQYFYIYCVFLVLQLSFITFLNSIAIGKELRSILSKKGSIDWIDSFNATNFSNNTYCHICCINIQTKTVGKRCGHHTLCKYKPGKIGSKCKGYIPITFSQIEKDAILDAHNTLRNFVANGDEDKGNGGGQPSASNMRALRWNNELALGAERWAAQCIYASDVCRDLSTFPVGQNVARGNFATNNLLTFIDGWYEEVNDYNASYVSNFQFPSNGSHITTRYTQMVWAETYLLGCARSVFQAYIGPDVTYVEHLICNYGPSGNIPQQPVYLKGAPCTACQEGTSCTIDYPALCDVDLVNKVHTNSKIRNNCIKTSPSLILYAFLIQIHRK